MGRIGLTEVLLVLAVVLLLFGYKRLPEVGSSIGKAIREFKKALEGGDSQKSSSSDKDHPKS